MARTYNESKAVFLAGPIEYWWDTEEDPNRFNSPDAVEYRAHRERVRDWYVANHYLVYCPWTAFKGDWNEKMQPVNDFVLDKSDLVVNLTPGYLPEGAYKGTAHEIELAQGLGTPVIWIPSITYMDVIKDATEIALGQK